MHGRIPTVKCALKSIRHLAGHIENKVRSVKRNSYCRRHSVSACKKVSLVNGTPGWYVDAEKSCSAVKIIRRIAGSRHASFELRFVIFRSEERRVGKECRS